MKFLKVLAYPFSLLYGCIMLIRNKLFDAHLLPSKSYNLPLICVGNLSVGGTGKTPHTEYIVNLLINNFKVGVLSRGYKRNTKGFFLVENSSLVTEVGDEVLQMAHKFENIKVAVCENRREGIEKLTRLFPDLDVIILDDAFQHRYVKPGLSILLSDYSNLYTNDFVMPTGNLREFISGARRAHIVCVTKSPKVLSPIVSKDIEADLSLRSYQNLYFTYIRYGNFVPLYTDNGGEMPSKVYVILLFAGIVNTYPLEEHLKTKCDDLRVIKFKDHYQYKEEDAKMLVQKFKDLYSVNKIIVTTEKDAKRLENSVFKNIFSNIPIFYIPIEIEFHNKYKSDFDNQILNYVRKNKTNR